MKLKTLFWEKIVNWIRHLYYSIPFGMKGAEDMIMLPKMTSYSNDVSIQEHVEDKKLGEDLLKGEITQEVIEFRYQTYKVYKEATKRNSKIKKSSALKFSQQNKEYGLNVHESLADNNSLTNTKRTLNIVYKDIPKFRLDKLCTHFDVICHKNGNKEIVLHFEKQYDVTQIQTRVFTSEIKALIKTMKNNLINDAIFKNHEIFSNIKTISFTTDNAIGEEDLMQFILSGVQGVSLRETKYEYIIVYSVLEVLKSDLTAKFYSKEAQDMYDTVEQKKRAVRAEKRALNAKCYECGALVNEYDAAITEREYGHPLCISCLEKKILSDMG